MLAMKFYMFESEPFLSFSFAGERNFAGELGERGTTVPPCITLLHNKNSLRGLLLHSRFHSFCIFFPFLSLGTWYCFPESVCNGED